MLLFILSSWHLHSLSLSLLAATFASGTFLVCVSIYLYGLPKQDTSKVTKVDSNSESKQKLINVWSVEYSGEGRSRVESCCTGLWKILRNGFFDTSQQDPQVWCPCTSAFMGGREATPSHYWYWKKVPEIHVNVKVHQMYLFSSLIFSWRPQTQSCVGK